MIIDYNNIEEEHIEKFKGGEGCIFTRNFIDSENKIMQSRLKPHSSSGYHTHEGTSEIVYIISGTGYFMYDGQREDFHAGDVHYCPMGHGHAMHNDGEEDVVYFAIVPNHQTF